jgi:hypothetical protein
MDRNADGVETVVELLGSMVSKGGVKYVIVSVAHTSGECATFYARPEGDDAEEGILELAHTAVDIVKELSDGSMGTLQ